MATIPQPNIIPKDHPDYRVWIYNKLDGEMLSKIVTGPQAMEAFAGGWRMSPAEFTDDEALKTDPVFEAAADDMAQVMNFMLNIDKCTDKLALRDFAENFLNITLAKNASVKTMKTKINKEVIAKGLTE